VKCEEQLIKVEMPKFQEEMVEEGNKRLKE
jgi:hypothetical protein